MTKRGSSRSRRIMADHWYSLACFGLLHFSPTSLCGVLVFCCAATIASIGLARRPWFRSRPAPRGWLPTGLPVFGQLSPAADHHCQLWPGSGKTSGYRSQNHGKPWQYIYCHWPRSMTSSPLHRRMALLLRGKSASSSSRRRTHNSLTHNLLTHTTVSHTHTTCSHTQLAHTQLSHTQLSHTTRSQPIYSHNSITHAHNSITHTHSLLAHTTYSHTHNSITHTHTQLMHTHTQLTHTQLTHTQLSTHTHTHNSITHNLRQTDRQTDRQTETETETETETDRQRQTETDRDRQTETERQTHTHTKATLSHASLSYVHFTISCPFPAFPIPSSPFFCDLLEEADMSGYPFL